MMLEMLVFGELSWYPVLTTPGPGLASGLTERFLPDGDRRTGIRTSDWRQPH